MNFKNKRFIILFILILLLMIIIPSSFAFNNETIDNEDDLSISVKDNNEENILTDYYFNASANDDGNGSELNPYKYLTTDKLIDNSVIHLSDGEYELDGGKSVTKISIIGQSAQNTIVKFKNSTSVLSNYGTLMLQNVTFLDVGIMNYATVNATNTIFKNSIATSTYSQATDVINSAVNSFGGSIYCPNYSYSTARVYIDNCSFINNTAEYGGAVYMYGGNLNIKNSLFSNNFAYNYGGAIACEYNTKVTISNTKFYNDKSLYDAGGAIYLKLSKLTATDLGIYSSYATFGSAITALNSNVTLNEFIGQDNHAKYEGGAIYQLYGYIKIKNSNLINNSARNGGGLFIDNTTNLVIERSNFINNSASNFAGAIYSLFNFESKISCNYENNTAKVNSDLFESSALNLTIGNGNYSLYMYNKTSYENLPKYYNSASEGFSTSIKDQQSGGNCWAFAGLAVLESCILKASGDNLDLSEENLKNLMELYSDYGFERDTNQGGYDFMIMAYLTSWLGPILESDDSYDDYSTLSPVLDSIMHVQNIKYVGRNSYTDNDAIKEAIYKYGAVGTGFYYDSTCFSKRTNAYFCSYTSFSNHAVAIVGWDDNYPRNNFITRPQGNGAWIVKNSWNESWGNNGYFYVSYYDTSFALVGDNESCYTFVLNDTIRYDKNYQYDLIGKTDYFLTGGDSIWYKNIFKSSDDEYLAAVSTYFEKECKWDLSIKVNNESKLNKSGEANLGYYTIDLGNYISLKTGDIFEVIFKITVVNASFPICEKLLANKVSYKQGISFFSEDGVIWNDLFDYQKSYNYHTYVSQVACIKAFTFLNEIASTMTLNISQNEYNPINIVANIINQFGHPVEGGEVLFNISGKEYLCNVSKGLANLTVDLEEMKTSSIEAIFSAVGYNGSSATGFAKIIKLIRNLTLDIEKHMTTAIINVNVSGSVNESIEITLNNKSFTVKSVNGKAMLVLNDLECGNYTVKSKILNETYITNNPIETFSINLKNSKIIAKDFIAYYNGGNYYSVLLVDENNNPISNREVFFSINNETFSNFTDNSGRVISAIFLVNGSYNMSIKFSGDNEYFNSSALSNITVKSTIISNLQDTFVYNSKYKFNLLNKNGNALNNSKILLVIGDKEYENFTDGNGTLSINIDLKVGKYNVTLKNPETGEEFTGEINVIPRITGNKDLVMYFNSGKSFKVCLYGDDANIAGEGNIILFKINKKKYSVKTDKNGFAALKINLLPNSYIITAEYNGFKVSNKIIVKKVLTAKNISKKKSKTIKFKAKLVNGNGKALKSKRIIFKFKGKIYKVKTNSKGIATLKLKNLKIGKYTITTSYGKSKIKNSIVIKK